MIRGNPVFIQSEVKPTPNRHSLAHNTFYRALHQLHVDWSRFSHALPCKQRLFLRCILLSAQKSHKRGSVRRVATLIKTAKNFGNLFSLQQCLKRFTGEMFS